MRFRNVCGAFGFLFCNFLFGFYFIYFCFCYLFLFFFAKNQENSPNGARYNPNNRKIAKIDAACDRRVPRPQAVDADARKQTDTHTHEHTLRTPHIAQFAAIISIACLYVFIFHMYMYISDMMSSLLLPVYL